MDKKKFICVGLLIFVLTGFGCSTTQKYGKYALLNPADITIDLLLKEWEHYHVYYAGVSVGDVNAILFDPRDDERRMNVHKWWVEVNDPETLSDLTGFIYNKPQTPDLRTITGPDDQVYGYLFSVWWDAPIKVVDNKTLWIDDLTNIPRMRLTGQ